MLSEIFSGKCPVCGGLCGIKEPLCIECFGKLELLGGSCGVCGFPLKETGSFCDRCAKNVCPHVDEIYSCYVYSGIMRKLLLSIKFKYNLRSALTFSYLLKVPQGLKGACYDAVVAVPSHPLRRLRRFCHPADRAADFLGKALGLPVEKVLYRKKFTAFQYKLKPDNRKENVKEAFGCFFKEKPLNILLVDDIFTTGSTVEECAKLLKSAGATKVDCFVIALD